jgi:hypothetical protein
MEKMKLYMVMLGCVPPGRLTEQHDIFWNWYFLERNDPKMKGFGLRPKDESISTPGAKFQ